MQFSAKKVCKPDTKLIQGYANSLENGRLGFTEVVMQWTLAGSYCYMKNISGKARHYVGRCNKRSEAC